MTTEVSKSQVIRKRKNKPGAGRKPSASTLFRNAQLKILTAHPTTTEIIIARAHGSFTNIVCPACKHKFDKQIGEGSDKELLKHLDDRVQGKATQRIEDTSSKVIPQSHLLELYNTVRLYQTDIDSEIANVEILEANLKALPVPGKHEAKHVQESTTHNGSYTTLHSEDETTGDAGELDIDKELDLTEQKLETNERNYVEVTRS